MHEETEKGLIPSIQQSESLGRPESGDTIAGYSVEDALDRDGWKFNQAAFEASVGRLRREVEEYGEVVFIPVVFGMPSPNEGYISEDNKLAVPHPVGNLMTYSRNPMRPPVVVGELMPRVQLADSRSMEMTVDDVETRAQAVRNHDRLAFRHKPSRINQNHGMTAMTDAEGYVSISLNAPMPLVLGDGAGVTSDITLPVPYDDNMETRLFFAAYMKAMGCDDELIFKAVGGKLRLENEQDYGQTTDETQLTLMHLSQIPSIRQHVPYDHETGGSSWATPVGTELTAKDVMRKVVTSAHFDDEGNVVFETGLK